jgi:hypothetical protein
MGFFEKYNPVSYALSLYGLVVLGDWISSIIGTSVGLLETNPLTRDAHFHYSLWRSILVDSCFFSAVMLISLFAYWALRFYSDRLGKFAASILFVNLGMNRLFEAVIPNVTLIIRHLHK